ncbi:MAG: 2-oxoacid:acceptor oxidoreductase subunit alpha [Thermoplasmata archaeon]|nr:MAG: 2-oxoacid:acceptor oxidoreductase subunit alpha [Thermoplasmata archaeon]
MDIREKYLKNYENKTIFSLGNEAVVYGALFAGCNFFAGYPITPSSEIAKVMARELPKVDGYCLQMEDEIASIAAVIGASWSGAKAMTATSGPGFSLMMENIGYAVMTETPCVIVNVQRSGPSTGQATKPAQGDIMQARWGTHGDHEIIALSPSSVQECFDLAIECFNLAERYRTPVIFLMDGEIAHLREKLVIPPLKNIHVVERKKAKAEENIFGGKLVPPMSEIGEGKFIHVTGSTHKEDGMRDIESQLVHDTLVRRLYAKVDQNREKIVKTEERFLEDAKTAVVAYGATARPAFGAVLKMRNKKIGFMRLITIWPFPKKQIMRLGEKVERIYVPELNLGQVSREIERFVNCEVVPISKIGGIPHTVDEIYHFIKEKEQW